MSHIFSDITADPVPGGVGVLEGRMAGAQALRVILDVVDSQEEGQQVECGGRSTSNLIYKYRGHSGILDQRTGKIVIGGISEPCYPIEETVILLSECKPNNSLAQDVSCPSDSDPGH
jgi:hypothetical protein